MIIIDYVLFIGVMLLYFIGIWICYRHQFKHGYYFFIISAFLSIESIFYDKFLFILADKLTMNNLAFKRIGLYEVFILRSTFLSLIRIISYIILVIGLNNRFNRVSLKIKE